MATKSKKNAFQIEAARIFHAQRAATRLLERTAAERGAVMSLSRDELKAIAEQMGAVASIAEAYHLEKAQVGSLAPEAFLEPAA
jgi:hypothetical protein